VYKGSGVIDRDEMRALIAKLNMGGSNVDQVADQLLNEADPSGDGEITFIEFAQTLKLPDKVLVEAIVYVEECVYVAYM
jgi:Ca2+-binding EF-hand superfamily protein